MGSHSVTCHLAFKLEFHGSSFLDRDIVAETPTCPTRAKSLQGSSYRIFALTSDTLDFFVTS